MIDPLSAEEEVVWRAALADEPSSWSPVMVARIWATLDASRSFIPEGVTVTSANLEGAVRLVAMGNQGEPLTYRQWAEALFDALSGSVHVRSAPRDDQ